MKVECYQLVVHLAGHLWPTIGDISTVHKHVQIEIDFLAKLSGDLLPSQGRYRLVPLSTSTPTTDIMTQVKSAPLVWINSFPSTGKLTIASILTHKLRPGECTLIHNHDLIDAVACPRDHPEHRRLRNEERCKAFARHVLAAETLERCVGFTGT